MDFAALLERHALDTPGPAGLAGLEHEYNVLRDGRLVDFRVVLPRLLRSVKIWHPAGTYGAFLDDGSLLCCDGTHAETAVAPETVEPGVFERISANAAAAQERLCSLLRRDSEAYALQGYSTHLSAYCRFVDNGALCARYARTYAPAMMMMIDRAGSPGLLVRPRHRRFEIGGDYLGPGPLLEAAACFFVATTLACMQDLLGEDGLVLLDAAGLEHPTQRPGWFVSRAAFGDDLYASGRNARLRCAGGAEMSAQDLIETAWRRARPHVAGITAGRVLDRIDAMVAGREPLPLERTDGQTIGGAACVPPGRFADLFGRAIRPIRLEAHSLTPHIVTWEGVVFRVEGDRTFYANVPRRHLSILDQPEEFDAALATFTGSVVDVVPESPALSETIDEDPFHLGHPHGDDKKKKKKGFDLAECMVTRLDESDDIPTVEVCIPETSDSLRTRKPQEPVINSTPIADGIMGHNGGWIRDDIDLQVQAVGFSFSFHRWYRSFVDHDGIMGHRWDHEYNQRVIPSRPAVHRNFDGGWCETYTGPDTSRSGDLRYCDGSGRVTEHRFESWHHRKVRHCVDGRLRTFRAVVTVYARNPGEREVIQRYAVYEGESPWGDPVFYLRRSHDGREQYFNCHGYLIALRDATHNIMRFSYNLPFNPGTRYLTLEIITDASNRRYRLNYGYRGGALRLLGLRELRRGARALSFNFDALGQLVSVTRPGGGFPANTVAYEYDGTVGRLLRYFSPELAGGSRSLVEVTYNSQEQVVTQREGGGTHAFAYSQDWIREHTDRRGAKTRYKFRPLNGTFIVEERAVQSSPLALPPQVTYSQPAEWLEKREYDTEFQVVRFTSPRGLVIETTYEQTSAPITEGDVRDWEERDQTWTTDLARGNKLIEVMISPRPGETPRVTKRTYERLFNHVLEETDPLGTITNVYDNGKCATPWNNTRPLKVIRPRAGLGATAVDVVEVNEWQQGGLLSRHVDPDGIVTEFDYNRFGICTGETVDPGGLSIGQTWKTDDLGRITRHVDPDGGITETTYDNRDNVVTITDPLGHVVTHSYDRNDSLTRVEQEIKDDPAGFALPPAPTALYALASEYDDEGRRTRHVKDADGLALTSEWDYDGEGKITEERTPRATGAPPDNAGAIRRMAYDARGLLYKTTEAPGTPDEIEDYRFFDPDGNLLATLNGERELTTWIHNGFGEQIQERDPVGGVQIHLRNAAGQVVRSIHRGTTGGTSPTDRSGSRNRVLSDTIIEPDAYDRLLSVRPAVFDPVRGRSANPPRLQSACAYTPAGRLSTETDPVGRVTVHQYDGAGRLSRTDLPGGHQRLFVRTPMGRLATVTQIDAVEGGPLAGAIGQLRLETTQKFDKAGRVVSRTLPGAGTTEYAYNSLNWPRGEKRQTGAVIVNEFDTAGRRIAREMPAQGGAFNPAARRRLGWSYDPAGNLVSASDGLGNTTTWTYDALDRMRKAKSPDGTEVSADLDKASRPIQVTYRGGETIRMSFDGAGRLVRKQHINPPTQPALDQAFEVDGLSRVTRMTDNSEGGSTVTRSYNSLSWLVVENQDGFRVTAGYDLSGRLTNLRYPSGRTVEWGLHPSGRAGFVNRDQIRVADYVWRGDSVIERQVASTLRDPGTGITYQFPLIRRRDYDTTGRLTSFEHLVRDAVVNPSTPQLIYLYRFGGLRYDTAGRLTDKQRSGNVEHYTYDLADQLVTREVRPTAQPGLVLLEETSFYDAAGNARRRDRVEVRTRSGSVLISAFQEFTPTNALKNRRAAVNGRSGPTEPVSQHRRGGLFSIRHDLPPAVPGGQALPGTRNTFFDALGRHRLCFVETDGANVPNLRVFNRHDASGRRLVRVEQDVQGPANTVLAERQIRYVFWGDRVVEEYERTSDTAPWDRTRTYVHGAEDAEVVTIEVPERTPNVDVDGDGRIGGDAMLALLQDHDGSALALCRFSAVGTVYSPVYERYYTDGLGHVERYRADGRRLTAITDSTIGHAIGQHGQWTHAKEGLAYALHRFRDTRDGIWISPEPAGDWADPRAGGNSFPYAGNNPVMATDPNGEELITLSILAALAIGTYLLAEYTESEVVAAFSPIHDAATAITGYHALTGRKVDALERGLSAFGAIISFAPILYAAGTAAKAAVTGAKAARAARGAAVVTDAAVQNAILEDAKAVRAGYGGSKAATQRIEAIIDEAITLAEKQHGVYKHGLSKGPLTLTNNLLNVESAQTLGKTFATAGWQVVNQVERQVVTLNEQVLASFANKPTWFARHIMGHEAQHVLFELRPGRLQFLRRLSSSESPLVRAIPRWIDESLAYGVSHGGRFRPVRALASVPVEDKMLMIAGLFRLETSGLMAIKHMKERTKR